MLREGEGKVACGNFLIILQGVGGGSTAHDYAKTQKNTQLLAEDRRLVAKGKSKETSRHAQILPFKL